MALSGNSKPMPNQTVHNGEGFKKSGPDFALHKAYAIATLELPEGQVAQLVERSPEKAGVGGSIPSLATNCIPLFLKSLRLQ